MRISFAASADLAAVHAFLFGSNSKLKRLLIDGLTTGLGVAIVSVVDDLEKTAGEMFLSTHARS